MVNNLLSKRRDLPQLQLQAEPCSCSEEFWNENSKPKPPAVEVDCAASSPTDLFVIIVNVILVNTHYLLAARLTQFLGQWAVLILPTPTAKVVNLLRSTEPSDTQPN